jgi:ubiquinone/menaquinone biosynthesis C-methylase UbiE
MIDAEVLLGRAVHLIRVPGVPDRAPELVGGGVGLRCPLTGRVFRYQDGVLDLLLDHGPRTVSQRALDTNFTTWLYDRTRGWVMAAGGLPSFSIEVANIQRRLGATPGDVIVDLACGHGNFTVEWSRLVGPTGLVLGLDISRSMLARAATRVKALELGNVLLIHADALQLPLADESVRKINCSGGFDAFPDLSRALREISRVSRSGAVLTASTFAESPDRARSLLRTWFKELLGLHFVRLPWLGDEIAALGYRDYTWSTPRGAFSYTSAVKRADIGAPGR